MTLEKIMNEEKRNVTSKYIDNIIIDRIQVNGVSIGVLSRELSNEDKFLTALVRCGINRYTYEIPPGLYLLGNIDDAKDVIVTCNYKLTIDVLRKSIKSKGLFILVLDTNGINVWCAAGKSTFASKELIYQLVKNDIKKTLKVRRIILPQLGATSMEPHIIRKMTGLSVVYGPIRAEDIDAFLDNSYSCDEDMRRVTFPFLERLKLTPLEFIQSIKYILISLIIFTLYSLLFYDMNSVVDVTLYQTSTVLILSLIGSIVFPLMLIFLPSKSFAINNMILSSPVIIALLMYELSNDINPSIYISIAFIMIRFMYSAFIGFRFTGSTTFTSFSGAKYEGKLIVKSAKIVSALSMLLFLVSKFIL